MGMYLTLLRRAAARDWARLGSILTRQPELKARYLKFRADHENQRAELDSLAPRPQLIDWSFYENQVQNKALLSNFMEQYNAVEVPTSQPARISDADLAAQQEESAAMVASELIRMDARKQVLHLELAAVNAEKSFEEMTTEEYMSTRPWVKEQIEENMKKNPDIALQ